jgi:choice-of-anchor A domain-containing protein
MIKPKTFLMTLAALSGVATVEGTVVNPLAPAQGFNAFIAGNTYLRQGDTHAGVALGGDLRFGSGFSVANNTKGTFMAPGDSVVSSLVVGGKVDFANSSGEMRVLNGGYAKVGNATGTFIHTQDQNKASINTRVNNQSNADGQPRIALNTKQAAASVTAGTGLDFGSAFTLMAQYSAQMSGLAPKLTLTSLPGDGKISYTPYAGELNVINLPGSLLNSISEFNLGAKPTADNPLVFNIDVGSGNYVFNGLKLPGLGESDASYILYNFYNASGTITFDNAKDSVLGSVFAPGAAFVKNASQNIVGQLVAASYVQNSGELHYQPFNGFIPQAPVPEMSTVAFGALMIGGVGWNTWRSRRK